MRDSLKRSLNHIPTSIVLFLFFFSIYAFTMSGTIQYGDEIEKYRVAQSIVERQDFSFRPTAMRNVAGVSGRTYSIYELGQTLLEVPLYVLGKVIYCFFPLPDVNWITMLVVGFLNPILVALAGVVLFKVCSSLGFRYQTSLVLTILFGFGTILWPYSSGFTREPLLTLLLLLSFYTAYLFKTEANVRWLLAAGIIAGYLVFSKFIHAMVIPFLMLYIAFLILENSERAGADAWGTTVDIARGLGLFVLPALLFLGLQGLYALVRFGSVFSGIAGTRDAPWDWILLLLSQSSPNSAVIGLLLSPEKSIFLYSPPVILLLVAWFKWLEHQKAEALLFLGLIAVEFGAVLGRPDWNGGTWWGPRYLVQITPLLIIPVGILLESSNRVTRKIWWAVATWLFAVGLLVQVVGTFGNVRDYLDIVGKGTSLTGQIDFLRHGALESLVVYLSPDGFPIQVNPYGLLLLLVAALLGLWLIRSLQCGDVGTTSVRAGLALLVLILLVEFVAFLVWIVAPYPQVLVANGNTKFVAGNLFLADGRRCEAQAMYLLALDRGTMYQRQALERLAELLPRVEGVSIGADDLMHEVEMPDDATVTRDDRVTLLGDGALRISVPSGRDAIVIAVASPFSVQPNQAYEISGWMKTEGVYGSGYAVVTVFEDDGSWGGGRISDLKIMDETHGWQPWWGRVTTLPTTRRLFVKVSLWKTFGTVWVEGIRLAQITNSAPLSASPTPCR
jgi:hypothetical protein